jgi:hypothetical protein
MARIRRTQPNPRKMLPAVACMRARHDGSLQSTVTPSEEVRPMNAVSMWVLSLAVTVGRLT